MSAMNGLPTTGKAHESGLKLIEQMERDVVTSCARLGREHPLVAKAFEALALKYNSVAMRLTEEGQYAAAQSLLTKAELLSEQKATPERQASRAKLLAVTVSNFGCFYQKAGDPGLALEYLGKALAIENLPGSGGSPAGTLLNICAVLSTLGRHEEALEHAQQAIALLTAATLDPKNGRPDVSDDKPGPTQRSIEPSAQGTVHEPADVTGGDDERRASSRRAGVLAVAYHSQAVQQEFLDALEDSYASYRQAVHVADSCWGPRHGMAQTLRASFADFMKKHGKKIPTKTPPSNRHLYGKSPPEGPKNSGPEGAVKGPGLAPKSRGLVTARRKKSLLKSRHWSSNPPSPRGLRIQRWLADEQRRGLAKTPETPRKPRLEKNNDFLGSRRWTKDPVEKSLVERWANQGGGLEALRSQSGGAQNLKPRVQSPKPRALGKKERIIQMYRRLATVTGVSRKGASPLEIRPSTDGMERAGIPPTSSGLKAELAPSFASVGRSISKTRNNITTGSGSASLKGVDKLQPIRRRRVKAISQNSGGDLRGGDSDNGRVLETLMQVGDRLDDATSYTRNALDELALHQWEREPPSVGWGNEPTPSAGMGSWSRSDTAPSSDALNRIILRASRGSMRCRWTGPNRKRSTRGKMKSLSIVDASGPGPAQNLRFSSTPTSPTQRPESLQF